jgi:excinuclease ABC subunit C
LVKSSLFENESNQFSINVKMDPSMTPESLSHLKTRIESVASAPGVYLMKDEAGTIIYVGKATSLKKRLLSYIQRYPHPEPKTRALVQKIQDIETILTSTENEALILESTLIKRHRPRYNVILKDDKRYPSLRLDTRASYPRLALVRRIDDDGALYFGPFSSASALHQTLHLIHRVFRLRKCHDTVFRSRKRPCLQYQIGRCLGPCCLPVPPGQYQEIVSEVILFLRGETRELIRKIEADMQDAAQHQDYEQAILLRDKLAAIRKVVEKQVVVTTDFVDRDVIALAEEGDQSVLNLMKIRKGHLVENMHFHFSETAGSLPVMLGNFIFQYYQRNQAAPDEVLVPQKPESASILQKHLRQMGNRKTAIRKASDSVSKQLMMLAQQNAQSELAARVARREHQMDILRRIQEKLGMSHIPERIACIDNSHWQGEEPVSSIVVFLFGKPCPAEYRKYRIRSAALSDDYAAMSEILQRRFSKPSPRAPFPDVLLVDGGKGQLHAAQQVLALLGLDQTVALAAIAKPEEPLQEDRIFLPDRSEPIDLDKDRDVLLLFQRIRDEAHRTAVGFHRKRKRATNLRSLLDGIAGVGPKRKKLLLEQFGDVQAIRQTTIEQMASLPGMSRKAAENVKSALDGQPG